MDSESPLFGHFFERVPPIFQSTESGQPFDRCAACDKYLLDDDSQYVIEKAFRSYRGFDARETVFEYALCVDCRDDLMSEFSEESSQRIRAYFESRIDHEARRQRLLTADVTEASLSPWISSCIVSGEPVEDLDEYQVYCECMGPYMLYTYAPFLIGGKVMDEVADLLSNKTLDELNGFADDILGLPPELEELFTRRVVIL